MADDSGTLPKRRKEGCYLSGPPVNAIFSSRLDELVAVALRGQRPASEFFNPSDQWLLDHMAILQDLPSEERRRLHREADRIEEGAEIANAGGKTASRAGPDIVVRLDSGGLAFFSQLGVARRPDLTQYFVDGFARNRDAIAFSESSQELFADVLPYLSDYLDRHFKSADGVIQTDRQIGDVPDRSFHARQLLAGTRYLQVPYMWRQLTFDLPDDQHSETPDILEISMPSWLEDMGLPHVLKARIEEAGLTQLIFKAPTKGLSLHLGFDYVGEHKMGPLSIGMFKVKQEKGLAVQAALSMARIRTLAGSMSNTALITVGPSLHGKSTLTIMIELANSELAGILALKKDPSEGIYPMNDDIVLLRPLGAPAEVMRAGRPMRISHSIDGTENSFYAMPFGLTKEDDPIAFDVARGTDEEPNPQETLENVLVDFDRASPNYLRNPVRNMRMILSRPRLLARKGAAGLIEDITAGRVHDSVHVPMEHTDHIFWQAVMRQNTVIPPLRRLTLEQYIRVLMYGEAVQMGAATGAINRPYVEYFSDPFIIGLEDENANLMLSILREMAQGGQPQEYYAFNTGGVGADRNEEASGPRYKKIPRELTLMLQEALLRGAVKFEYDPVLRSDVAVAIVNSTGEEALSLRTDWLPGVIYGEEDYARRVVKLQRRRYYGWDSQDRAGILRYTKVDPDLINLSDIPPPDEERELAWLLSFFWNVDRAYDSLAELAGHINEGRRPESSSLDELREMYEAGGRQGLKLSREAENELPGLGIRPR